MEDIKKAYLALLLIISLLLAACVFKGKTDENEQSLVEEKYINPNIIDEEPVLEPEKQQILETLLLEVPLIPQLPELPTGCEITSAAMLLQYAGVNIDKLELVKNMPYDDEDPNLGYVGDPYSWHGWTIYPEPLSKYLESYLSVTFDVNISNTDEIKESINAKKPVVVWLAHIHGLYIHSVIITGYNQEGFYYNDPLKAEKNAFMVYDEFIYMWEDQDKRALTYK